MFTRRFGLSCLWGELCEHIPVCVLVFSQGRPYTPTSQNAMSALKTLVNALITKVKPSKNITTQLVITPDAVLTLLGFFIVGAAFIVFALDSSPLWAIITAILGAARVVDWIRQLDHDAENDGGDESSRTLSQSQCCQCCCHCHCHSHSHCRAESRPVRPLACHTHPRREPQ